MKKGVHMWDKSLEETEPLVALFCCCQLSERSWQAWLVASHTDTISFVLRQHLQAQHSDFSISYKDKHIRQCVCITDIALTLWKIKQISIFLIERWLQQMPIAKFASGISSVTWLTSLELSVLSGQIAVLTALGQRSEDIQPGFQYLFLLMGLLKFLSIWIVLTFCLLCTDLLQFRPRYDHSPTKCLSLEMGRALVLQASGNSGAGKLRGQRPWELSERVVRGNGLTMRLQY